MTLVPADLVALRKAVDGSYDLRGGMWRPDPRLLVQLVAAEEAWSRELLRMREGSAA